MLAFIFKWVMISAYDWINIMICLWLWELLEAFVLSIVLELLEALLKDLPSVALEAPLRIFVE